MSTNHTLHADSIESRVTVYQPTIWQSANFSEPWYRDAVKEAAGVDEHATRREIIFSICFLESYIFEWVRAFGIEQVNTYFPPDLENKRNRDLKEKWKNVPAQLFKDGVIASEPKLDLSELGTLIRYRNGLVHARASRPSTAGLHRNEQPVPAIGELRQIGHGWALGVAERLVKKLHSDIGTSHPGYMCR